MRLTYIFAVVIAGTLHVSSNAFPAVAVDKGMTENGALPGIFASTHTDGHRLLRRVENEEEERVLNFKDKVKVVVEKLNPVKAAEKAKEKIKDKIEDPSWPKLLEHIKKYGDKRS